MSLNMYFKVVWISIYLDFRISVIKNVYCTQKSHRKNWKYVSQLIDIDKVYILYLGKQGMAYRGHDETQTSENKGNNFFILNFNFNIFTLI